MCQSCISISPTNELAERFLGYINGGAIAIMCSIGHRTGLFDTLATLEPSTSQQIADAAQLDERYVREWLGAMVTGRIVCYDPGAKAYWLPEEHAALLTRSSVPNNLAGVAQWIAVMGDVEDQVVQAFKDGKGVPYSAYTRFHQVMAEESGQTVVAALDEHIIPLVPGLAQRLEAGIDVIDFGCGSGWALIHLAERYPASRFVGIDISDEATTSAGERAASLGLTNIDFKVSDAATFSQGESFDLVTAFDIVHDQRDPAAVLSAMRSALRPGGTLIMQDIKAETPVEDNLDNPFAPFIYTISCTHCMSVSLAQGGAGLGAAWGKGLALEMLAAAGFENVRVEQLDHDELSYFYIVQLAQEPVGV